MANGYSVQELLSGVNKNVDTSGTAGAGFSVQELLSGDHKRKRKKREIDPVLLSLSNIMESDLPSLVKKGAKLTSFAYAALSNALQPDDTDEIDEKDKKHPTYKKIQNVFGWTANGGDNAFVDFLSDMSRQTGIGWTMSEQVQPSWDLLSSGNTPNTNEVIEYYKSAKKIQELGTTDEVRSYQKIYEENKETYGGTMAFIMGWAHNPTYMVQVSAQSLANMVGSAVHSEDVAKRVVAGGTTAAGGAFVLGQAGPQALIPEELVTVPTAFIAGAMGTLSGSMEVGHTFSELLQEQLQADGKKFTPENIEALLKNPETITHKDPRFRSLDITGTRLDIIRKRALRRGTAIGLIDGITAGVTKGTVTNMFRRGVTKKRIGAVGTGMAMAGGLASEIGGQTAGGQEFEWGQQNGSLEQGVYLFTSFQREPDDD